MSGWALPERIDGHSWKLPENPIRRKFILEVISYLQYRLWTAHEGALRVAMQGFGLRYIDRVQAVNMLFMQYTLQWCDKYDAEAERIPFTYGAEMVINVCEALHLWTIPAGEG